MKKILRNLTILCLLILPGISYTQCPAGFTGTTLNWDYMDYFVYTGNYTTANGYLPSNAAARTQNFAFGLNRLTITHNIADANSLGDNTIHTGEAGSYGVGADINFNVNGTITYTFETEVQNFRLSLYDLDDAQTATVTATNALGIAQVVTLSKTNAASTITFTPLPTGVSVQATSVVGGIGNSSTTASINIDVAGPVKTVTIVMGGTGGDFWLSDVQACTSATFPNNYFAVSRPFTGMPGYVLHAFDKSVYAVNPANGVTKLLFTDPTNMGSSTFINSMAYDVYNRILYYVFSLTATPSTNRILRKYDFNTETMSTVINDINTIGVPTGSTTGIESGAASFYNGSLYLGIETINSGRTSGRESIIWRIDFDASNIPYRACQAFGIPADDGAGLLLHDWSDFTISNGILYDFDGAGTTTQTDTYHTNLMTGATINYPLPSGWTPGQPTVGWNETIYQLHAINPSTAPYVAVYNAGAIGPRTNLTSTPMFTPAVPSLGDAAEAYRPLCDFGDAPATYDPVALSPAVHEISSLLYLGTSQSKEWVSRGQTALANADNFDDGLLYVPTYNPLTAQYLTEATVFNNTGANATLTAWLDFDGSGVFDAGEAVSYTVPTSASPQNIYLYWTGIPATLANGSTTYLRVRLTSAANAMTTANATGYFSNGEVEDYRVLVNSYALSTQMISFDAEKINEKEVKVNWSTAGEQPGTIYELQRSDNIQNWNMLYKKNGTGSGSGKYSYADISPLNGNSYYRLKTINPDGSVSFSQVRMINIQIQTSIALTPNPASGFVKFTLSTDRKLIASVWIMDVSGRKVYQQYITMEQGTKTIPLDIHNLTDGMYTVQVQLDQKIYNQKLVIKK